jgi:hypothetical protein
MKRIGVRSPLANLLAPSKLPSHRGANVDTPAPTMTSSEKVVAVDSCWLPGSKRVTVVDVADGDDVKIQNCPPQKPNANASSALPIVGLSTWRMAAVAGSNSAISEPLVWFSGVQ